MVCPHGLEQFLLQISIHLIKFGIAVSVRGFDASMRHIRHFLYICSFLGHFVREFLILTGNEFELSEQHEGNIYMIQFIIHLVDTIDDHPLERNQQ